MKHTCRGRVVPSAGQVASPQLQVGLDRVCGWRGRLLLAAQVVQLWRAQAQLAGVLHPEPPKARGDAARVLALRHLQRALWVVHLEHLAAGVQSIAFWKSTGRSRTLAACKDTTQLQQCIPPAQAAAERCWTAPRASAPFAPQSLVLTPVVVHPDSLSVRWRLAAQQVQAQVTAAQCCQQGRPHWQSPIPCCLRLLLMHPSCLSAGHNPPQRRGCGPPTALRH